MKTICISLERRLDRRNHMDSQFANSGLDFQYLDATDGVKQKISPIQFVNYAEYACLDSHIRALEMATDNDITLILEDDVVFCDNINERILEFLEMLPDDWGIAYLGTSTDKIKETGIVKANGQWGAWAYIVNRNSALELLIEMKKREKPSDMYLVDYHKKGTSYIHVPFLVYVINGYSDIRGKMCQFNYIKDLFIT